MKRILLTICLSGLLFLPTYAEEMDTGAFSIENIEKTFAALDATNKYAEQLAQSDLNVLPIGMKKTISNNVFTLAVSSARFYSTYAELTLFARLEISQRPNKPLYFVASTIKFSYEGGFTGDASLVMCGEEEIPVNQHMKLILHGGVFDINTGTVAKGKKTAVTVDCSGFKELEIEGSLVFSDSLIQRVSDAGVVLPEKVSTDFSIVMRDWNDLFLQINLPAFQIKGLDGFIFTLSDVAFDFSDYQNPDPSSFPAGYAGRYIVAGAPELWRGVCAKRVQVSLPKDFSKGDKPITFSAQNLVIDHNGVSGLFAAENILPISAGSASGWAFSIDKFYLEMEANRVKSGGFDGLIGLPVGDSVKLDYKAQMMGNNKYQLAVALKDTLPFDMLAGKATLLPNSSVTLQMNNGKFKPEANLNGYLTLKASLTSGGDQSSSSEKEGNKIENIEFRALRFKTENPYVSVEYMGYKGEIKLFNLPVSISDIKLTTTSDQMNLAFDVKLNLDDKFLSASSRLNFKSKYIVADDRGKWKFQGVSLEEVVLRDCEIAGVLALSGKLQIMNNDPDYGNGFYGELELKFKKIIEGCNIKVATAFGSKDGDRYWFVDGSASLPAVIPIAGPIGINGIGGGLCMGMKRVLNGGLGKSKTGCGFMPDKTMGLGLKAAVLFKSIQGNAIRGDASFEILFNRSGGINTIGFYGFAEFAASVGNIPDIGATFKGFVDKENKLTSGLANKISALEKIKQENPSEAAKQSTNSEEKAGNVSIGAAIGILYSVQEKTLHANFDFFVDAAGGMVQGVGSKHRAGWAVLHFSPEKWYVFLGTPDDRVGLRVGIPGILTVKADGYFMMGDDIPGSPPPPEEVTSFLAGNGERFDYMRDLNRLKSGLGFAFGTSLSFNTGDLTFLILYAKFNAVFGFDLMLKDYKDAQCKGRSGPIGINGWYANGQAYAYLGGELGVKVKLWFIKAKIPIISGACGALVQAKLPNPLWLGGAVGVKFSVLGGVVKGSMRFKFAVGDECEIVIPGGSPLETSMINDINPAENATEVDVFAAPQLVLANPAMTSFKVNDENGKEKTYRISLDKFTVKDGNNVLQGEIRWNADKTTATFYSHEVLPPQKKLVLDVEVGFQELAGGKWNTVVTGGQKAVETRSLSFTTGEAPDYIPVNNIVYTYPIMDQQYYYVKESTSGYVQLDRGQSYLFPATGWTYNVQFDRTGKSETKNFSYNAANKRVYYTLPVLVRGQKYDIKFLSKGTAKTNTSAPQEKQKVLLDEEDNQVVQSGAAAGQVIQENDGKLILGYQFNASNYETFADKMSKVIKGRTTGELEGPYIVGLGYLYSGLTESFGNEEIFGNSGTLNKPMIQATANLTDSYYNNYIYPLIYTGYPPSGVKLNRSNDEIGIPPVRAFGKWMEAGKFPIRYELPKYYLQDYLELRSKVVNNGLKTHPLYSSGAFPDILSGKYPVVLQYVLPGEVNGTSVIFEYEINKQ